MTMSKYQDRLLIINEGFPGLGGERATKFTEYLPQAGIYPIVITNTRRPYVAEKKVSQFGQNDSGTPKVLRAFYFSKSPFRVFSKFFGMHRFSFYLEKFWFVPDQFITWVPSAVLVGLFAINKYKVDVIFTTSPPESCHLVGYILSKITGRPWIADFRDLWTAKKIVNVAVTPVHRCIYESLERLILNSSSHIIANTEGNRDFYIESFKVPYHKISYISNGFDPHDIKNGGVTTSIPNNKFTIGYLGFFDKPGFPWMEFLLVIKKLCEIVDDDSVRLIICGRLSDKANVFIDQNLPNGIVLRMGILSHYDAVQIIKECKVLLLLLYETGYSRSIVPHKLYNYLGMMKPVVAIAEEDGEVANILRKTNSGRCFSVDKKAEILEEFIRLHDEWKRIGKITYGGNSDRTREFEIGVLVERLAQVIKTLVRNRNMQPEKG